MAHRSAREGLYFVQRYNLIHFGRVNDTNRAHAYFFADSVRNDKLCHILSIGIVLSEFIWEDMILNLNKNDVLLICLLFLCFISVHGST